MIFTCKRSAHGIHIPRFWLEPQGRGAHCPHRIPTKEFTAQPGVRGLFHGNRIRDRKLKRSSNSVYSACGCCNGFAVCNLLAVALICLYASAQRRTQSWLKG